MAALDNDSDGELDAEKPLLPARIIPSTYAAEGDLSGGGIPYGWTFETLIGKGTIRERLQRDDSALIKAALRDPHARAAVERREGRRPSRVGDDEWETRLRSRFVRMFINFEFLSTRKRVAVFAFSGHGKYQASLTTDLAARAATRLTKSVEFGAAFAPECSVRARKALVARWLRELRLAGKTRAKTDVAYAYQGTFEALGFRAATFQNGVVGAPCPVDCVSPLAHPARAAQVVRMSAALPRWLVVGPVVLLAELLRHDRAKLRGAPPTADAVARLLWTCGTHDRDHWSHAFLRNALMYF